MNFILRIGLLIGLLISASCSYPPPNRLCDMPSNRHFWQGVDVSLEGDLIEFYVPPHGGIYFQDWSCGSSIGVRVFYGVYERENRLRPFGTVIAKFRIRGRFVFNNGQLEFDPTSMDRLSPWLTDPNAQDYLSQQMGELQRRLDAKRPN